MSGHGTRSALLGLTLSAMLAVLTTLRFLFWWVFAPAGVAIDASTLARSFYLGFKFDLRLVLLALLPLALLSPVRTLDPTRSGRARRFWIGHLSLLAVAMVALYGLDLANYAYLGERLDASLFRYLNNPVISLVMVWESYPVLWCLLGLALFGLAFHRGLGALWPVPLEGRLPPTDSRNRRRGAVVGVLVVAAYLGGIYGKLSYYPLRWSDAFFTTERFVSQLALNPILFLANTWCTAEGESIYDLVEVASRYDVVADYLDVEPRDRESFGLVRYVRPPAAPERPVNVVLILGESLAARKTGAFGNPLDPSPHLDAIAARGWSFRNFYTPRLGTARGVFGTLTGIPDTITYRTASRNPRTIRNHTILRSFEGYRKCYFLGGSANWANIRALFSHNLEDIEIYEEGAFDSARADGWGVPDYHLVEEANRVLSSVETQPFFAFIHLAGNHRPYTIPDDIPGFEPRQVETDVLARNGFGSLAEFNSFRLLDHSIGHFLEIAAGEDYFDDTLFVILSDNGGAGPVEQPRGCAEALNLDVHHTPLVFYGPGLIPGARVVDTMASQLDVLPTIASLVGIPALNTSLGRDLTAPRSAGEDVAFIYRKRGSAGQIGLLGRERVLLVDADGGDPRFYACAPGSSPNDVGASMPREMESMRALALGLFHASKYVMYHNAAEGYDARGISPVGPTPAMTGPSGELP